MIRTSLLILLTISPALASAGKCNAPAQEDFAIFFSRFSDDKRFSVERTMFPLRVVKWEYGLNAKGQDESAARRYTVAKDRLAAMPPLSTTVKNQGLSTRFQSVRSRLAVVEIFKEGSDWFTEHHFKRVGHCWFLFEYQDHSL